MISAVKIDNTDLLSVLRRLWLKREVSQTGCWLWTGRILPNGYGMVSINHRRKAYVHRIAYELFVDDIRSGLQILHSCDIPRCFNPDHLWPGTQADNMHDMIAKGRMGKRFGRITLTPEQVLEIYALRGTGITQDEVAYQYNIAAQTVGKIWLGQRWRAITLGSDKPPRSR